MIHTDLTTRARERGTASTAHEKQKRRPYLSYLERGTASYSNDKHERYVLSEKETNAREIKANTEETERNSIYILYRTLTRWENKM